MFSILPFALYTMAGAVDADLRSHGRSSYLVWCNFRFASDFVCSHVALCRFCQLHGAFNGVEQFLGLNWFSHEFENLEAQGAQLG